MRRISRWRIAPASAILLISLFLLCAIFADLIAPHDPVSTALPNRFLPPAWLDGGTPSFPLGTDQLGRDILSRLVYGSRTSLFVATFALAVGAGIGLTVGLVSGHFGGLVDTALMRVVDGMLSIPVILLALIFVVTVGPSTRNVVLAVGLVLWARIARIIRGEVLAIRNSGFVQLARIAGASHARVILKHLLPNVANTAVVMITLQVGYVILVEAALSFLGAGVPPPTPAWGSMIAEGREYVVSAWWVTVWPGIATILIVLAFNFLGDWLRDELDPRLKQV